MCSAKNKVLCAKMAKLANISLKKWVEDLNLWLYLV